MHITKITVSYQETQSLGDYSNVKPSVTLEVALTEGDDFETSFAAAQAIVRRAVQGDVDDALEAHGRPARYSTQSRYTLFTRHRRVKNGLPDLAVIGPADAAYHPSLSRAYRNFRLPAIRRLAAEHYDQSLLIDTIQEPDALAPVLEHLIAEEAQLEVEREQQRKEQERRNEEWQRRYAAQNVVGEEAPDTGEGDDDED